MRPIRYTDIRNKKKDYNPHADFDQSVRQQSFISNVIMILLFILVPVLLLLTALTALGWIKFVAFGDMSNDFFWTRLWQDITRLNDPQSIHSLKQFYFKVLH